MLIVNSDSRDEQGYKVCDEATQFAAFYIRPLTLRIEQELREKAKQHDGSIDHDMYMQLEIDHIIKGWDLGDLGDEHGQAIEINTGNKISFANKHFQIYMHLRKKAQEYQRLIEESLEQEKKDLEN